jgi:predicted ABC-type ATPase
MPELYIIAGCNGAGKTTASYTILPEMLNCREFVNADSIAAGLSPFNPGNVAFEAGRIMLQRIDYLLSEGADFAFETTLSTRSYVSLIKQAKLKGYNVTVEEGGHDIPSDVIVRRYYRGIYNLINLYIPICDNWMVVDNMKMVPNVIAENDDLEKVILNNDIWQTILRQSNYYGK